MRLIAKTKKAAIWAFFTALLIATPPAMYPQPAVAASAAEINRDVGSTLQKLYARAPSAKALAAKAKGILVFPSIIKAGLMVGGQYNTVAASYGLQAGAQSFGYALFFMTDSALSYLDKSGGWEIGAGPSIVVVDEGMATSMTTTTGKTDIYAFIFNQKGLMGGLGLQGTKITKIKKQ